MMKHKELVLPRNVPPENFQSNLTLYTQRRHSGCSSCVTCGPGARSVGLAALCVFLLGSLIFTCLLVVNTPLLAAGSGRGDSGCRGCEVLVTPDPVCPPGHWRVMAGGGGVTCEPCLCSVTGARDLKCDQVTGQCACRPGHSGHKCDICPGGGVERSGGCWPRSEDREMADTEAGVRGPGGCERDAECGAPGGRCVRATCECGPGYLPSSRHVCKKDPDHVSHNTRVSPCSGDPCGDGGTCEEHDGTFTCYCPPLRSGPRCERRLEADNFTAAAFHGGRSRVTLTSLNIAGLSSDIKLQFRTFTRDGLLFRAPGLARERRLSRPDHLTLEIADSRVKFSFRVSGSEVSLLSEFPVKLGSWHSLHVQRYRAHAVLNMDSQPPVRGQAASTLSTLNLDKHAYVGSAPGLDTPGLQGCIRDLSIGKTRISLVTASGPLVTSTEGIRDCDSHPCDLGGCHHEAECVSVWPPDPEVRFLCHCAPGYTGHRCQHRRGPCHPNPCRHGGQCRYDEMTGISCECQPSYSGKLCHRSEK